MIDPEPLFENLLALNPNEIFVPGSPGPDDPREVYAAVGYALTMWEDLEEQLCNLFRTYLGTMNDAVTRAYGSIVSGQGRVGMLKEVIEATYAITSPDTATLHTKAMNKIGALAGRRNEIAHGIVSKPTVNNETFGYCLLPPSYNAGKTYSMGEYFSRFIEDSPQSGWLQFHLARGKYVYTHVEILRYAEMFRVAKTDVQQMGLHLFVQRVKHLAQAGDKSVQYQVADDPEGQQAPPPPSEG